MKTYPKPIPNHAEFSLSSLKYVEACPAFWVEGWGKLLHSLNILSFEGKTTTCEESRREYVKGRHAQAMSRGL